MSAEHAGVTEQVAPLSVAELGAVWCHTIAEEMARHLQTADPVHPCLEVPLDLDAMAILSAGLRAAETGALEPVDNHHWSVG